MLQVNLALNNVSIAEYYRTEQLGGGGGGGSEQNLSRVRERCDRRRTCKMEQNCAAKTATKHDLTETAARLGVGTGCRTKEAG